MFSQSGHILVIIESQAPESYTAPCSGESGLIHSLEKKDDLQDRPVEDASHLSLLPQAPSAPASRS